MNITFFLFLEYIFEYHPLNKNIIYISKPRMDLKASSHKGRLKFFQMTYQIQIKK